MHVPKRDFKGKSKRNPLESSISPNGSDTKEVRAKARTQKSEAQIDLKCKYCRDSAVGTKELPKRGVAREEGGIVFRCRADWWPVGSNQNPSGLNKNGGSFVSFSLSFIQKEITQTQPKNPSTVSLPHRRKEWHTAAVHCTQSSPSVRLSSFPRAPSLQPLFAVTDRGCFLELGVRRLCLLSRASVAVCVPFTFAFLSSSFAFFVFTFARRSPFAFTRRSPFEFAFAFVWKPRCSASNSATNPRAPPSRRTALFCRRQPCSNYITSIETALCNIFEESDFLKG
ncbi:hypothetical protein Ahy_A03g012010 isoform A [Arachis hypogaea]|uniref:Transmembrane protein n=1 Tax=Arachis hypogaea TaxID=3818 RepID=A0A445DSB5_ARAHY|nr:hypothetical protein Ahy_A03g012010 isoform A [Arachis hypogaea]